MIQKITAAKKYGPYINLYNNFYREYEVLKSIANTVIIMSSFPSTGPPGIEIN